MAAQGAQPQRAYALGHKKPCRQDLPQCLLPAVPRRWPAGARRCPPVPAGRALLSLEFIPPDRRRRDDDNCIAAFKSGRDGVAQALGIDDSRFVTQLQISAETIKGGAVRVRISDYVEAQA